MAERPDWKVAALAAIAAVAAAAICLPRDYQRSGLHVPLAAALGVMAVGIAVAALAAYRPWPALLAWILAMPFFTAARLGPFVGWIQLTPSTVILATLACAIILGLRRRSRVDERVAAQRPRSIAWLLAIGGAMALLAVVPTALSPDLSTGIPITMHGVLEPILIGLVVIAMRPTTRQLAALGSAMAASVAIAGAVSLGRMLTIVHSFGDFQNLRAELGRVTYYNVGILGGMLVMVVPFIVIAMVRPGPFATFIERAAGSAAALMGRESASGDSPYGKSASGTSAPWAREPAPRAEAWVRITGGIMLALVLLVTYLTYSKSALIATLAVFVGLALAIPSSWRGRGLACVAVLLASVLVVPYGDLAAIATGHSTSSTTTTPTNDRQNSFDPNSPEGEVSITERYIATKAAIAMTIDHPLVGVGPGLFGVEYAGPYHDPQAKEVLQSPHDVLPDVSAEYGLPLAILLAVVVIAAFAEAWHLWKSSGGLARLLALAFGLSLLAFVIVATLFGTDLYRAYRYMNTDMLYFGLVLGSIAALRPALEAEPSGSPARSSP